MFYHRFQHIQMPHDEYSLPILNDNDSDRTTVTVPTNIFTKDDMLFKVDLSKDVFIVGNDSSVRQDIVLQYSTSAEPIAICKLMLGGLTTYKLYTTKPNYPGQIKSNRKHNKTIDLYTYAEVKRTNKKNRRKLLLVSPSSSPQSRIVYTIQTLGTQHRVVFKDDGTLVSIARCHNIDDMSTHLSLANGIDPYLMVCVEAMCERLDLLERDI
jgi:hypothetical protein